MDPRPLRFVAPAVSTMLVLSALFACRPADETPVLRVTGASTVYPIVRMAADPFRELEGVRVEAQAGGSTRGFADTVAGRNDLGAMARSLTEDEAGLVFAFPVARDGVGLVVHADNPISGLTTDELRRVYRGEVEDWSELGGPPGAIVAVGKAEGHATLETFLDHTGLTRAELAVDVVAGDNAQVIRVVGGAPHALGYVSLSEVLQAAEEGAPIRLVPLDGVAPTLDNVRDGTFPMARTLYLVSKDEPTGPARAFLDFLAGEGGHQVIERGRYVPNG